MVEKLPSFFTDEQKNLEKNMVSQNIRKWEEIEIKLSTLKRAMAKRGKQTDSVSLIHDLRERRLDGIFYN